MSRLEVSVPLLDDLVGLRNIPADVIEQLLDTAAMLRKRVRGGRATDLLVGRAVALMFMEPSTRTRFSFERAARKLGAEVLAFSSAGSSTTKGETLLDTARLLRAVGSELVVLRHEAVGAPHCLARQLDLPVVNAGDGINEHPTQALLDALTLRDHFGDLRGIKLAIVGDVRHSRVARSNCFALSKLGAKVVLAGPGTLCPPELRALGVETRADFDHVLSEVDAVMMLRIQHERLPKAMIPSDREFSRFFGLTAERLAKIGRSIPVLHPAPLNRGVEIASEVADGPQSLVFRQMANGVAVRMAVLAHALCSEVV